MKKIFFEGDHKDYHAGSAAVSDFIRNVLTDSGYQFVPTIVESDICLVNGEGSMHHQSVDFHRKMRTMHRGKQLQKKVFLVNSVWQDNGLKYHDLLTSLDGIAVRGVASQKQLHIDHGIKAARHLDFSYFLDIDESVDFVDFDGAVVMTDCWISPGVRWAWLNVSAVQSFRKIDLKDFSWSSLIKSLRTASLLVTGRHHGMYAACKAEIPFVCMRGNCHKMEDLLHSSRVQIPVARNTDEVLSLVDWAVKKPVPFERLFNWMRDQTQWAGINPSEEQHKTSNFKLYSPSLQSRASMAERKKAFSEASKLWQQVGDEADNSQQRRLALNNALRCATENRDIPSGVVLLTKLLTEDLEPAEIKEAAKQFRVLVRHLRAWDTKPTNYCIEVTPEFARLAACLYGAAHDQELDLQSEFVDQARESVLALDNFSDDKPLVRFLVLSAFAGLQRGRLRSSNREFFKDLRNEFFHSNFEKIRGYREFRTLIWPRTTGFKEFYKSVTELWKNGEKKPVELYRIADILAKVDVEIQDKASWLFNAAKEIDLPVDGRSRIAMRLLELGNTDLAVELMSIEKSEWKIAAEQSMILAHLGLGHLSDLSPQAQENAECYSRYQDRLERVKERLRDKNSSVAVVGNSPCELGKRQGNRIDDHDLVIRFNSFSVDPPFNLDYGEKTTMVNINVRQNTNWSVFRDTTITKLITPWETLYNENIKSGPRREDFLAENVTFFPPEQIWMPTQLLDCGVSLGLAFAIWLKELRGHLNREDFFGFSFTDQVESTQSHYFNDETPSITHDWFRERELFNSLFTD